MIKRQTAFSDGMLSQGAIHHERPSLEKRPLLYNMYPEICHRALGMS